MDRADLLASVLVDHAIAEAMVPLACPCDFGAGGRYRLEEVIGVGRDSLVYRAKDRHLSSEGFDANVAVKIARVGVALRHDALSTRRISHPNVLSVIDQGVTDDGTVYLVSELVQGGDLSGCPGPWPATRAAAFIAKLAGAVQAAHSAGVVHCDLKPANILLGTGNEPKLADFDLSCWGNESDAPARGNAAFMAPEQLRRDEFALTPPCDIYALGGLLFWLLTGRLPNGQSAQEVEEAHRTRTEAPSPGINRDLDQVCRKAMAPRRDERYHSAGEMADDLNRWLHHVPIPWTRPDVIRRGMLLARRRPAWTTATVLLLLGGASLAGLGIRHRVVEARQEARMQAEALRLSNAEIERLKARVREAIRVFYRATFTPGGGDIEDQILPSLVWLQWLTDTPVLDDLRIPTASERITLLRSLLAARGEANDLATQLTRYSLAHFLIDQGEGEEAASVLAALRAGSSGMLGAEDPMWTAIEAMEACANYQTAADDTSRAESRGRIEQARDRLAASGTGSAVQRLANQVLGEGNRGKPH